MRILIIKFLALSLFFLVAKVAGQTMSDRESAGFKGSVKHVLVTGTITDEDGTRPGFDSEAAYDEKGNQTLEIFYFGGDKTKFFVLDGMKVSSNERIKNDSRVKLQLLGTIDSGSKPNKKADPRYDNRYAYKYDSQGRTIEELKYKNDGVLDNRTVYTYDKEGNRVLEIFYNGESKWSETKFVYDKNKSVVQAITKYLKDGDVADSRYSDWKIDVAGNWIERKETNYNKKGKITQTTIEKRVIHYY